MIKWILLGLVAALIIIFIADRYGRKRRWRKTAAALQLDAQARVSAGLPVLSGIHDGRQITVELSENGTLAQTILSAEFRSNLGLGLVASSVPWTTTHANQGVALTFYGAVGKAIADLLERDPKKLEPANKKLASLFECTANDRRASRVLDDEGVTRALLGLRQPRTAVLLADGGLEVAVRGHITSPRKLSDLLSELSRACDDIERAAA